MAKKDLFHKDIEGRLDELKHGKPKKERPAWVKISTRSLSSLWA